MLDRPMRKLIDPPLNAVGRKLAALGIRANAVTLAGLIIGPFADLTNRGWIGWGGRAGDREDGFRWISRYHG